MYNYFITFGHHSVNVNGCEAAYALFLQACDLAEIFGINIIVALRDGETGEIIADNLDED